MGKVTDKLVPFMIVFYVGASVVIIFKNIDRVPKVIAL
ncbi:MAG: alanine:cation symporter family protein, partial [Pseudomonadota bacterium]